VNDAGSDTSAQDTGSKPDVAADTLENPSPCDVIPQNCGGTAPRCSVVGDPPYSAECVAKVGSKPVGEPCTPDLTAGDDCVKGAFCTVDGYAKDAPHCAKLCKVDGDCGSGESCVIILAPDAPPQPTEMGVCRKTCAPYSDCGAGQSCAFVIQSVQLATVLLCKPDGAGAIGTKCLFDDECQANLGCAVQKDTKVNQCAPTCDATHPCPTGKVCAAGGICR
jgi:hypothetical protein